MDKKEFSTFAMAIRTYYPKENILPNQQAMELWYRELQDIPYNVAEASLRQWVSTNKWSPSIAEIREMSFSVQNGNIPDWGEGWEQVLNAIRKFGSYRIPEAMESFDPITRRCVERLGFRNICMSENINADRANFRMIYEQLAEREKKESQMALPLKQIIQSIQEGVHNESNKLLETDKDNGCKNQF
jgi:hypothetical protein